MRLGAIDQGGLLLHQVLAERVKTWRDSGYPADDYPALAAPRLHPDQVEDITFTGALTDAAKIDFRVQYQDQHGQPRSYSSDFVIRRKPLAGGAPGSGRAFIVEIKREHERAHPDDGENGAKAMAVRRWVGLNPERLRYEMIFTDNDLAPADRLDEVRRFVAGATK